MIMLIGMLGYIIGQLALLLGICWHEERPESFRAFLLTNECSRVRRAFRLEE